MKILIVCDTYEGLATELSLFMKNEAVKMNRRVTILDAHDTNHRPGEFDAIVIVGEVRNKELKDSLIDFIRTNLSAMNLTPSFFIPLLPCEDENNLSVPESFRNSIRELLLKLQWAPQQVLALPVGIRLQLNEFITLTDWDALKISLQRFMVRNDVVMVG